MQVFALYCKQKGRLRVKEQSVRRVESVTEDKQIWHFRLGRPLEKVNPVKLLVRAKQET